MIIKLATSTEELRSLQNEFPNDTTFGVTTSGNIYRLVDNQPQQLFKNELDTIFGCDTQELLDKAIKGELINTDAVNQAPATNDAPLDKQVVEEPVKELEELIQEDVIANSNIIEPTLEDTSRLEALEDRVAQLEGILLNIGLAFK